MTSVQFINEICLALDQTACPDNNKRMQAETFIHQVSILEKIDHCIKSAEIFLFQL